ncbi:MAG: MotA/TolQ/ExbB proton channel family protein [Pseudomonadota bacterium]
MITTTTIMDYFHQGGFVMYPLLFFSVLIWAVGLQKMWFLSSFGRQYNKVYENASKALQTRDMQELRWAVKNASPLISKPHEVLFDETIISKDMLSEKLHRRLMETQIGMKRKLWILGTIGSSAPFVGLFGTVIGIMTSFKDIGLNGKGGFAVVSAGISESLIATASGIIIAVIAVMFYNYFQTRINNIFVDYKNKVEDLAQLVCVARTQGLKKQANVGK